MPPRGLGSHTDFLYTMKTSSNKKIIQKNCGSKTPVVSEKKEPCEGMEIDKPWMAVLLTNEVQIL